MRLRCRIGIHKWVMGETEYLPPESPIALFYLYRRTCKCCPKAQTMLLRAFPLTNYMFSFWHDDDLLERK